MAEWSKAPDSSSGLRLSPTSVIKHFFNLEMQGFHDSYQFCGNIIHKHRQIENAVPPPPLAFALGRKLKEAVTTKSSN
ncbi:hypothetical protein Lal_00028794 [Lupinus albus]|nr:hypothetical protein Lal_00028794 [Lupinus albus]